MNSPERPVLQVFDCTTMPLSELTTPGLRPIHRPRPSVPPGSQSSTRFVSFECASLDLSAQTAPAARPSERARDRYLFLFQKIDELNSENNQLRAVIQKLQDDLASANAKPPKDSH